MSMLIFAIAASPAAIVYLVAKRTNDKATTQLTAIAMAFFGLIGSPAFLVIDLLCVAAAYHWVTKSMDSNSSVVGAARNVGAKVQRLVIAISSALLTLGAGFVFIFVAITALNKNNDTRTPAPAAKRADPGLASPLQAARNEVSPDRGRLSKLSKSGDLRSCLDLADNAAIARCTLKE